MNIIGQLKEGILSKSAEKTEEIAYCFSEEVEENCVLALHGDLGAGKTTFVRGLARAWGIEEPVTSPTYNLFNLYKGLRTLVHLDAYRLKTEAEAEELLIEDFLEPPFCLAVEWPSHYKSFLMNEKCWHLYLNIVDKDQHLLKLKES